MEINTVPTQQTAAVTDAILAVISLAAAGHLFGYRRSQPLKAKLWSGLLASVAIAAALGTVVHAFVLPTRGNAAVWTAIHLVLWVGAALLATATLFDAKGPDPVRRALPAACAAAFALFAVTRPAGESRTMLIAAEGLLMAAALAVYLRRAVNRELEGAWLMVLGIGAFVLSAGQHAAGLGSFTLLWQFDRNGTCHLIQAAAVVLLALGVREALRARESEVPDPG